MSKKHEKLMQSGKDKHHVFFPKKLYGKDNVIVYISYALHHSFHDYFMAQCKNPKVRACRLKPCRYWCICCYAGTDVEFGRRVI